MKSDYKDQEKVSKSDTKDIKDTKDTKDPKMTKRPRHPFPLPKDNASYDAPPTDEELQHLGDLRHNLSARLDFDLLPPPSPDTDERLQPLRIEEPLMPRRRQRWQTIVAATTGVAAAVLLVLFGLPGLMRDNAIIRAQREMIAEANLTQRMSSGDSIKHFRLPDGTHIYMNRGTSFTLHKSKFNAHFREIWLNEGEAFFEVAKDPGRPFIVHTPDGMSVKVLGTSFNISAYKQLSSQVVSVRTGKVMVQAPVADKPVYLTPDQAVSYSAQQATLVGFVTDGAAAADWRKGDIVLRDAPVDEVVLRLAQTRGITIVGADHIPHGRRVNATFLHHTATRVMAEALAQVYGVRYTLKGQTLTFY